MVPCVGSCSSKSSEEAVCSCFRLMLSSPSGSGLDNLPSQSYTRNMSGVSSTSDSISPPKSSVWSHTGSSVFLMV
eukprot:4428533-Prymnesium_polylepis.1